MELTVGPAKRRGESTRIFGDSLSANQISTAAGGELLISFDAGGMYDRNSTYRYTLRFSRDDLNTLIGAVG
jgi:hypothetical protein